LRTGGACQPPSKRRQLWRTGAAAVVGSPARRPVLRENRRLPRAEVTCTVVEGVPPALSFSSRHGCLYSWRKGIIGRWLQDSFLALTMAMSRSLIASDDFAGRKLSANASCSA